MKHNYLKEEVDMKMQDTDNNERKLFDETSTHVNTADVGSKWWTPVDDLNIKEENLVESENISVEQKRSSDAVEKLNLIMDSLGTIKLLTCSHCGCKAIPSDRIINLDRFYVCLICELRNKLSYSLNEPLRKQMNQVKYKRYEQSNTEKIYISKEEVEDILKKLNTTKSYKSSTMDEIKKKFTCYICEYNAGSRKSFEIHNADKTKCIIDLDLQRYSCIRKHTKHIHHLSLDNQIDGAPQIQDNSTQTSFDSVTNQYSDTTEDPTNSECSSLDEKICKDSLQKLTYNEIYCDTTEDLTNSECSSLDEKICKDSLQKLTYNEIYSDTTEDLTNSECSSLDEKLFKDSLQKLTYNEIYSDTTVDLTNSECSSLDEKICKDSQKNLIHMYLSNSEVFHNLKEDLKSEYSICGYTDIGRSAIKRHCLLLHNVDKPFGCRHCDYRTKNSCSLKRHLLVHFQEKPFTCHIFGFKLKDMDRLRKHLRTHVNHRLFVCNICGFKTTQSHYLKKHMIVHDDRPYACGMCDYKSKYRCTLNKHKRTHMNARVKRYACSLCPFKTDEAFSLRRHRMAVHTNERPYACNICNYKTVCGTRLKYHTLTHTNLKLYSCKICAFKTNHCSSLIRHNNRFHGNAKSYSGTASLSNIKFDSRRSHLKCNASFSNNITEYNRNIHKIK